MALFEDLLAAFAQRLELERLAPGADGTVDLSIEKIGRLQLEENGEWLLVTLARPAPPHAANTARTLLKLTHWRENLPRPVHPGMKGNDWLTLTARLPLTEADLPELERAIGMLAKLHDQAAATE